MIRLRNKTNLISKGNIDVEIFPELVSFPIKNKYYWRIYYWKTTNAMLKNTPFSEKGTDTLACFVNNEYKDGKPQNYLGELHFVKNKWDLHVVNHEMMHAMLRLIADFYPKKVLRSTKCKNSKYKELEENICELISLATVETIQFLRKVNKALKAKNLKLKKS